MPMPISLFGQMESWNEAAAAPFPMPETPTDAPSGAHRSKSEPRDTPRHEHTPKGVDISDSLHRLAGEDTNVAALVNWGLTPHLQDGELVIDGMDVPDAESRAGR